jgi:hypothetical protein
MELTMDSSIENQVHDTEKRLFAHEAICAERYEGIQDSFAKGVQRMQKIEYLLYAVIFSVLFGKDFILDIAKHYFVK